MSNFTHKRILITGGTGFLGRGILRRIQREGWESDITVFSRDEYKQDMCRQKYPKARYVLGDVRNSSLLLRTMRDVDLVIHTAAIKYVPESEINVTECLDVNVGGTKRVIECAGATKVPEVVFISTDKAVEPVNVYGATKMICERLVGEAANWYQGTRFVTTRYGNVVGSTGSVIPIFRQQFKNTGRVQITDISMTRFWISIDEAVDLIEHSLDLMSGMMLIPQAGACSIGDVAEAITGDRSSRDIIGMRPGEKRYESLVHYQESVRVETSGKYFYLHPQGNEYKLNNEPFTYVSRTPRSFIGVDELREMIEESEYI